jgi:hypothetical protein
MKKLITMLLPIILLISFSAFATSTQVDGDNAYRSGNYAKAFEIYKELALKGNAEAQLNLGVMYGVQGVQGVVQDDAEAVKWYSLAAAQGLAGAQHNLGLMYEQGRGVAQDDAEAVKWYSLAAAQGLVDSQLNLGNLYSNLNNYVQAYMWLTLVADRDLKGVQAKVMMATSNINALSKVMSKEEIAKAKKLARQCQARKFKGCNSGNSNAKSPSTKLQTNNADTKNKLILTLDSFDDISSTKENKLCKLHWTITNNTTQKLTALTLDSSSLRGSISYPNRMEGSKTDLGEIEVLNLAPGDHFNFTTLPICNAQGQERLSGIELSGVSRMIFEGGIQFDPWARGPGEGILFTPNNGLNYNEVDINRHHYLAENIKFSSRIRYIHIYRLNKSLQRQE